MNETDELALIEEAAERRAEAVEYWARDWSDERLLQSSERERIALEWAISTGAKP